MSTTPPSFIFRDDYQGLAIKCHSIFSAVTTTFLFARLWVRAHKYKGLWWDDYILTAAWACLMVGNGTSGAAPAHGFNIATGSLGGAALHFTSISACYLAIAFSKTAFTATLLRLTTSYTKAILWFLIAIINASGIVMVISTWIRICDSHMEEYTRLGDHRCLNFQLVMWLHTGCAIISLFADIVLTVYPWTIVKKVRMSKKEKRAVASTMSLVGVSAITTIVKIALQKLIPAGEFGMSDFTFLCVLIMCFQQGEAATMIIAQTLPVLRVFYQGSSKSSSERGSQRGDGSTATKRSPAYRNHASTLATRGSGLELEELPGGRIVTVGEARRTRAAGEIPPAPELEQAATTGSDPVGGQPSSRLEGVDEVHRVWAELGLSRRAWSQSPPLLPPRQGNTGS